MRADPACGADGCRAVDGCERTGRGRLDHQNKKVPIRRPAANAQSPRVQAEMTRARLRRSTSCKVSWDRSVIAAPLRAASHCRKIGVLASAVPNIHSSAWVPKRRQWTITGDHGFSRDRCRSADAHGRSGAVPYAAIPRAVSAPRSAKSVIAVLTQLLPRPRAPASSTPQQAPTSHL
jgi:hypothetical protein